MTSAQFKEARWGFTAGLLADICGMDLLGQKRVIPSEFPNESPKPSILLHHVRQSHFCYFTSFKTSSKKHQVVHGEV